MVDGCEIGMPLDVQKIDKELASDLANLEKEKEEALKDLDAQVTLTARLYNSSVVVCCTTLIEHEHMLCM